MTMIYPSDEQAETTSIWSTTTTAAAATAATMQAHGSAVMAAAAETVGGLAAHHGVAREVAERKIWRRRGGVRKRRKLNGEVIIHKMGSSR